MATQTFTAVVDITSDAIAKDWVTKFIAALDALTDLTKVTDQTNRGVMGGAMLDLTDKTSSGVTTTAASKNFSGTFNVALGASDVGRMIRITGAGSAGAAHYSYIETVTSGTTGTLVTAAVTSVAGTGVATIGVFNGGAGSSPNYYGHIIYRFNDAEQATLPMFVKFYLGQFGVSPTNNSNGHIGIEVGTALDGSNNLSRKNTLFLIGANANVVEGVTPRAWKFSADPGRFMFAMNVDSTTAGLRGGITIARSVDDDGVNTDEFFQMNRVVSASIGQYIYPKNAQVVYPQDAGFTAPVVGMPNTFTSFIYDGNTSSFPIQPLLGRLRPPLMDCCIAKSADYANNTTTNIDMYGADRTFLSVIPATSVNIAGQTNVTALMRYE